MNNDVGINKLDMALDDIVMKDKPSSAGGKHKAGRFKKRKNRLENPSNSNAQVAFPASLKAVKSPAKMKNRKQRASAPYTKPVVTVKQNKNLSKSLMVDAATGLLAIPSTKLPVHFKRDKQQQQQPVHYKNQAAKSSVPTTITLKGEGGPTTITINNMHEQVTQEDIKAVFQKYGDIVNCILYHDGQGRSLGTCELTYALKEQALQAINGLHNVVADGRKLNVALKETAVKKSTFNIANNFSSKSIQKTVVGGNLYADRITTTPLSTPASSMAPATGTVYTSNINGQKGTTSAVVAAAAAAARSVRSGQNRTGAGMEGTQFVVRGV